MDRLLNWFAIGWIWLIAALNLFGIIVTAYKANGFFDAWREISEIYSPFNFKNWLIVIVSLSPAFGAFWLLNRRREAAAKKTANLNNVADHTRQ